MTFSDAPPQVVSCSIFCVLWSFIVHMFVNCVVPNADESCGPQWSPSILNSSPIMLPCQCPVFLHLKHSALHNQMFVCRVSIMFQSVGKYYPDWYVISSTRHHLLCPQSAEFKPGMLAHSVRVMTWYVGTVCWRVCHLGPAHLMRNLVQGTSWWPTYYHTEHREGVRG